MTNYNILGCFYFFKLPHKEFCLLMLELQLVCKNIVNSFCMRCLKFFGGRLLSGNAILKKIETPLIIQICSHLVVVGASIIWSTNIGFGLHTTKS